MKKIKINNLRSLDFNEYIKISELTILLGKNSTGKSTFLRSFPLLGQSFNTPTNVPILWYGNLTDFGSFEETVNYSNKKSGISFGYQFNLSPEDCNSSFLKLPKFLPLTVEFKIDNITENFEFIKEINLKFRENNIEIIFNPDGSTLKLFKINSFEFPLNTIFYELDNERIFPNLILKNNTLKLDEEKNSKGGFLASVSLSIAKLFGVNEKNSLTIYFSKTIERILKTEINIGEYFEFIQSLVLGTDKEFYRSINKKKILGKQWKNYIENLNINSDEFRQIKNSYIFSITNELLILLNDKLKALYANINYIAPVRASAERYYRMQGLNVDFIDPTGRNLPMFIQSLPNKKREQWSKWIQENFGFYPTLALKGGHASLKIRMKNKLEINLTDNGFGYSQILPIITQLWIRIISSEEKKENKNFVEGLLFYLTKNDDVRKKYEFFVIEQPELHLHPAMQAILVDVFIRCLSIANSKGLNIKFIIETHSESIINRIGKNIFANKIAKENVEVIIFDKKPNTEFTDISISTFDNEGLLNDWPYGFFDTEVEL